MDSFKTVDIASLKSASQCSNVQSQEVKFEHFELTDAMFAKWYLCFIPPVLVVVVWPLELLVFIGDMLLRGLLFCTSKPTAAVSPPPAPDFATPPVSPPLIAAKDYV